jgi:hypothetical protein
MTGMRRRGAPRTVTRLGARDARQKIRIVCACGRRLPEWHNAGHRFVAPAPVPQHALDSVIGYLQRQQMTWDIAPGSPMWCGQSRGQFEDYRAECDRCGGLWLVDKNLMEHVWLQALLNGEKVIRMPVRSPADRPRATGTGT